MNTEQFDGHTPGPWYLNTPDPNPSRTVRFISDVCTDLLGATDADARLIAAAPDLLAELKRLEKQVADLKAQVENLLEFGEYFLCRECELHSPIDDACECCPHCGEHPGEPDLDRLCGECNRELNDEIAMRDEIAHGRL